MLFFNYYIVMFDMLKSDLSGPKEHLILITGYVHKNKQRVTDDLLSFCLYVDLPVYPNELCLAFLCHGTLVDMDMGLWMLS